MRIERSRNRQGGTAMVEFAVILPMFILLVFGMIQFGLIINAKISLQDTAEMVARHVVVDGDTDTTSITNYARSALPSNLPSGPLVVTYTAAYPVGAVNAVRIDLQYPLPLLLRFVIPGGGSTITLNSSAIMR